MPKVSRNYELIQHKTLELDFLNYAMSLGYSLIDFELIEHYAWNELTPDQLKNLAMNYNWINGQEVNTLRSDWTSTIVAYQQKYKLKSEKIAYCGPVFSKEGAKDQLGMEIFTGDIAAQQKLLTQTIGFIEEKMESPVSIVVVSHNKLLKKILTERQLADPRLRGFIEARDSGGLSAILGAAHPLIRMMDYPLHEQVGYLGEHYPELSKHIEELNSWIGLLKGLNIPYVYADILALPSQSYYRGIFFKGYHEELKSPIIGGGQYTAAGKAFGVGINTREIILKRIDGREGGSGR